MELVEPTVIVLFYTNWNLALIVIMVSCKRQTDVFLLSTYSQNRFYESFILGDSLDAHCIAFIEQSTLILNMDRGVYYKITSVKQEKPFQIVLVSTYFSGKEAR